MKTIVIVCGQDCVYCKKAKMLMKRAVQKNPEYKIIKVDYVMESSFYGNKYKHKLVPAFFCCDRLVFEGNPDMQTVKSLLKDCYESNIV